MKKKLIILLGTLFFVIFGYTQGTDSFALNTPIDTIFTQLRSKGIDSILVIKQSGIHTYQIICWEYKTSYCAIINKANKTSYLTTNLFDVRNLIMLYYGNRNNLKSTLQSCDLEILHDSQYNIYSSLNGVVKSHQFSSSQLYCDKNLTGKIFTEIGLSLNKFFP